MGIREFLPAKVYIRETFYQLTTYSAFDIRHLTSLIPLASFAYIVTIDVKNVRKQTLSSFHLCI